LILLDACRADKFKEVYQIYFEGKYQTVWSPASRTVDWFNRLPTINGVYFSPVPWITKDFCRTKFKSVIEIFRKCYDKQLLVTKPECINKILLLKYITLLKKERSIIHYPLPHYPYLGEIKFPLIPTGVIDNLDELIPKLLKQKELLARAYMSNLNYVLKYVHFLCLKLKGKIVITSDHAELLGEHNLFFHNFDTSVKHKELREVPWLEITESKHDVEWNYNL